MNPIDMGTCTVRDVEAYLARNRSIILPYGIVEQHGHHLPLDTDSRIARIMALQLGEKLGWLVAPTLTYCFSGGMLPGTINIKPNTFSTVVGEIVESLVVQGFENIFILPGHGGSESLFHLKESLRILKWVNPALAETLLVMLSPWDYSPTHRAKFGERDYHAGEVETSLLLAYAPEVVRAEVAMDEPAVAERLRVDPDSYQERTAFTDRTCEIPRTRQKPAVKIGVMGYPERANAELGRTIMGEFLDNAARELAAMVAAAEEGRRTGRRVDVLTPEELRLLQL